MKLFNLFVMVITLTLGVAEVEAGSAVIVHPESPLISLDKNIVSMLFSGKINPVFKDTEIIIIDQPVDTKIRKKFSKKVLKLNIFLVEDYWMNKIMMSNVLPPIEMEDDKQVKEYISSHIDAIGYIDDSVADESVKILFGF